MIIKNKLIPLPHYQKQVDLTIGTFDSFHKGHWKVLDELIKVSRKDKAISCVLTFINRPKHIISSIHDGIILDNPERITCFKKAGIDLLFFIEFNQSFAHITPEDFIKKLIKIMPLNRVILGEDFKFGYKNRGTVDTWKELSKKYGYKLKIIRNVLKNDKKISTTLIKQYLKKGRLEQANRLLNRHFHIDGKITRGIGLGKKINFPTINLELLNKSIIIPSNGVYLTKVQYHNKLYYGMTYIGINYLRGKFVIETHIFHFHKQIYGKQVKIFFIKKLRKELRLSTLEEVKKQLQKDKKRAINLI